MRPTTPWNYGLVAGGPDGVRDLKFEERPVGEVPFSADGAGMAATARARRMPSWKLVRGWAAEIAPPDEQLADPGSHTIDAPDETVTLIPYGCTSLRIAEFPKLT